MYRAHNRRLRQSTHPHATPAPQCEGCELDLFRELLDRREDALLPEQIAIELHSSLRITDGIRKWGRTTLRRYEDLDARWSVPSMVAELHRRAGFSVIGSLVGERWAGFCCSEALLARTRCPRHSSGCRSLQQSMCAGGAHVQTKH